MEEDIFSSNFFYISYHGIDICRNRVKKLHIDYDEIKFIEIKRVRAQNIRHRLGSLIIGLLVTSIFINLIIQVTPQINFSSIAYKRGTILLYISYYIFSLFGLALILNSIKKTLMLRIFFNNGKYQSLPLPNHLYKPSFISFLKKRTETIVKV